MKRQAAAKNRPDSKGWRALIDRIDPISGAMGTIAYFAVVLIMGKTYGPVIMALLAAPGIAAAYAWGILSVMREEELNRKKRKRKR